MPFDHLQAQRRLVERDTSGIHTPIDTVDLKRRMDSNTTKVADMQRMLYNPKEQNPGAVKQAQTKLINTLFAQQDSLDKVRNKKQ